MSNCHDSGSVATLPRPSSTATPGGRRLVAVVGPPNSGKSTLFNRLTGLRQKVANYPGVTVEKRDRHGPSGARPAGASDRSSRHL